MNKELTSGVVRESQKESSHIVHINNPSLALRSNRVETAVPIWSPKLSSVEPVQYLDREPLGNTGHKTRLGMMTSYGNHGRDPESRDLIILSEMHVIWEEKESL